MVQLRAEDNSLVAEYIYSGYGEILSIKDASGNEITDVNHIANVNPIRYRGYYYDTETGFYYLRSIMIRLLVGLLVRILSLTAAFLGLICLLIVRIIR